MMGCLIATLEALISKALACQGMSSSGKMARSAQDRCVFCFFCQGAAQPIPAT